MKTLPSGMQDHLDGGTTTLCRCWQLTRKDGVIFGFTDHDEDLAYGSVAFEAATGFTATAVASSPGLNVDNLDVEGALNSNRLNDQDLARGLFDNAAIVIWLVNWQDVSQRIILRAGNLGQVSRGPQSFNAELRGLAHHLNQPSGRVFQRACDATLGDARCGVDATSATHKASGTVTSVESNRAFKVSGLENFATRWFSRGELTWSSGTNDTFSMEVKQHTKGRVELWLPMADTVEVGDTFDVITGCDKSISDCRQKFSNVVNFRGCPHMPGNDFVVGYPNADQANTGGSGRQENQPYVGRPGNDPGIYAPPLDTGTFSSVPDVGQGSTVVAPGDVPDTGSFGGQGPNIGGIGPDDVFIMDR